MAQIEFNTINDEPDFEVSNTGIVRNKVTGKIRKPFFDKNGYVCINLHNHWYKVHRLVAQAFIPNPDNLPQINHKDEDKTNNNVSNLEWCDAKYNINYGTAMKRAMDKRRPNLAEFIRKGIDTRKLNNPNNEMYYKIAESKRLNGTNHTCQKYMNIEQYTVDGILVNVWKYLYEIKDALNVQSTKNIRNCIRGKQKTAYGYVWKV